MSSDRPVVYSTPSSTARPFNYLAVMEVTTMSIRWQRLLLQSCLWLLAEVVLTSIGMDDIADYGEYHFASRDIVVSQLVDLQTT